MCVYWEQIPPRGVVERAEPCGPCGFCCCPKHFLSCLGCFCSPGRGRCRSRDMSGFSPSKDEEAAAAAEPSSWQGFHDAEGPSLPQSKLGQPVSAAKWFPCWHEVRKRWIALGKDTARLERKKQTEWSIGEDVRAGRNVKVDELLFQPGTERRWDNLFLLN